MKQNSIFRSLGIIIILISVFLFSSCTKTADENLSKDQSNGENLEAAAVEDSDITESDEDLTTVDYKEFYEQLSPLGEWVQVKPEEIGMKPISAQLNSDRNKSFSLLSLFGIQDANATTSSENTGMVYVWKPSTSLAVTNVEGVTPVYVPYSNGNWINTNKGWYFKANTPAEETTSHYGRWVNSPTAGWLWVPGRVWAPAWVDWKQNDKYVSWAPLPPSVYMVNGSMSSPVIDNSNYVVVEKRYFLEPDVYRYNNTYNPSSESNIITGLASVAGLTLVDNLLFNRGPEVSVIQTIYGREIGLVNIQQVRTFNEVRYTDREYYVYHPGFKRYKHKGKSKGWFTVNEPKQYRKYGDWNRKSDDKEYKNIEKELKSEQKEYRKEDKEIRKQIKKSDDGNMYNGKKNNGNDKGTKNEGNVKGRNNNGNDNGKKHDGSGNENKQKGNDGNKNKGNNKKGK